MDSFSKIYPNATEIKWAKENKDFEAGFKLADKDML